MKIGEQMSRDATSVQVPDKPRRPSCTKGHGEKEWCVCWKCGGEGLDGHDCGEDCCCCLYPEDNVTCDICRGKGGWWRCYTCAPATADEEI